MTTLPPVSACCGRRVPAVRPVGRDGDRGAGTVLVIGLVAVVLALTMATGVLVQVEQARAAAQAAADLAALAAATELARAGAGDACRIAADVAARNGARASACRVEGGDVVEVRTVRPAGIGTATGRARAGPVEARAGPVQARAGVP